LRIGQTVPPIVHLKCASSGNRDRAFALAKSPPAKPIAGG
jgi:hypothetical protein